MTSGSHCGLRLFVPAIRKNPNTYTVRARRHSTPTVPDIMTTQSAWLTAGEAAQYLKVKTRTILMWARQGKVKGYVLSGTSRHVWRFQYSDLDAMLSGPAVLNSEGGKN